MKRPDKVRRPPIKVMVKDDGVWLNFEGANGRQALLNLNNIVNELNPSGITQNICAEAIQQALEQDNE